MSELMSTSKDEVGMNPGAEGEEIDLLDLMEVVVNHLRMLVFVPLMAGLLALGIAFYIAPTFTATTRFIPPQQQQSAAAAMLQNLGALGGLAGASASLKNPVDQYVAFLKSQSVQDALIDRFALMERYQEDFKQDTRKRLDKFAQISSGKDGLVSVAVDDHEPAFAAKLANAYVEELGKLLNRLAVTEAQQRRAFFEKQLLSTKAELIKAEQALRASGVTADTLKANPQSAVEGLAKLQAAISAQEVKVASMRGYLAESAPDFRQAQTELAALRNQLARLEQQGPRPGRGDGDYIARFRNFKYQETLFDLFARQYEIARVDESREGALIQVVDVAQPPERKSKPKKALIAIVTALATGFALLLFILARYALSNPRKDPVLDEKLARLRASWRKATGRGG